MEHEHISKVLKWGYKLEDGDMIPYCSLYGCTECDATSEEPFPTTDVFVDHTKCGPNCFGCKAKSLQLNAGDATREISDKKWTGELNAYKEARAQGMQPGGTSMQHIEAAHKASEVMNKPYNAETMPPARYINKNTTEVLKEVGTI